MTDRTALAIGIALALVCGLVAVPAQASVKCQCNNGSVAHAMGADWDDEDVEEACDDACSTAGGGRVWSVDTDRDDDDGNGRDRVRPPARPAPRRR